MKSGPEERKPQVVATRTDAQCNSLLPGPQDVPYLETLLTLGLWHFIDMMMYVYGLNRVTRHKEFYQKEPIPFGSLPDKIRSYHLRLEFHLAPIFLWSLESLGWLSKHHFIFFLLRQFSQRILCVSATCLFLIRTFSFLSQRLSL